MADELIDRVDKNDKIIGSILKSQAHKSYQIFHREACLVIVNDLNEVLLQQRSLKKKNSPGVWKMASAGHPKKGESPKKAIIRETKEELGLKIKPVFFDKRFQKHIKPNEHKDARFMWIYYCVINGHPKLKIQKSEVSNTAWVKFGDIEKFSKINKFILNDRNHRIIKDVIKFLKPKSEFVNI